MSIWLKEKHIIITDGFQSFTS